MDSKLVWFLALAPAAAGCADLSEIQTGVCGNGVVEVHEDCDSPGASCGKPGSPAACRYTCGQGATCPAGYSCGGKDQVCRKPYGELVNASAPSSVPSRVAGIADFDGDGYGDVLAMSANETVVHYLGERAAHLGSSSIPGALSLPVAGVLTNTPEGGRSRASFAVAHDAVYVVTGQPGRVLAPKSYAPFTVPKEYKRFLFVDLLPSIPGQEIVAVAATLKGIALVFPQFDNFPPVPITGVDASALPDDIPVGNFDQTTACDELLIGGKDAKTVDLVGSGCDGKFLGFKKSFNSTLPLPVPPATADNKLAIIAPTAEEFNNHPLLAAGDLNGDGKPDFVMSDTIIMSGSSPTALDTCPFWFIDDPNLAKTSLPDGYTCTMIQLPAWEEARIGRFNDDAVPDIVGHGAASQLQLLIGASGGLFNTFEVSATGRVKKLQVGDVDGDLIPDFVFVEENKTTGDSLGFSMGQKSGGPETPIHVTGLGSIELTAMGGAIEPNFHIDAARDVGIVIQKAGERSAAVFYGSPQRFFVSPYELQADSGYAPATRALLGNFDGEGHEDLAVLTLGSGASVGQISDANARLWVLPSQGDAELSSAKKPVQLPTDAFGCEILMTTANLDAEGTDEVVMLAPGGAGSLLGPAPGPTDPQGSQQAPDDSQIVAVDMDGDQGADARPDVLATVQELSSLDKTIALFRNDGSGKLQAPIKLVLPAFPDDGPYLQAFAAFNFDGDPQKELVLVTAGGAYVADLDLATGELLILDTLPEVAGSTSVKVADIDGDGIEDLAFGGPAGVRVMRGRERAP
jgi:hypothetical protein